MSKSISILAYGINGKVVIDNCDLIDISILSPVEIQVAIMWGNFGDAIIP
jgi:ABC-type enterochelin transport system permease subunit